jgi:hypothetical protein
MGRRRFFQAVLFHDEYIRGRQQRQRGVHLGLFALSHFGLHRGDSDGATKTRDPGLVETRTAIASTWENRYRKESV